MERPLCRVLLVDDNEDDQLIVRDLLADIATTEFQLQWADSYEAAREALSRRRYDVCLLDYRLGEANGVDLLREFAGTGIPFILLTGEEDYEVDVAATKAGSSDYLIKGHINGPLLERSIRYATEHKKTEQALLQAQSFAQATVDALPSSIAVLDGAGNIVTVNEAWRKAGQVGGLASSDGGIHSNYLQACEANRLEDGLAAAAGLRSIIDGSRHSFTLQYHCRFPEGTRWYQMEATRFNSPGPLRIVVAHDDITHQKLAENALRASELRFQSIVTNVPGMVYQYSSRSNGQAVWVFISEGCRDIFGVEPETLKNDPLWLEKLIHPEDLASFQRSWTASNETLSPWHWEGRHVLPSGKSKWIQGGARLAALPEGGAVWNGLIMDVTALKEAEAERDRYFTMSIDLLGIAGLDGYFKRLNPAFTEALGFSEAEITSVPLIDLVHPDDRVLTELALNDLRAGKSVAAFENRYRCKDGSWRWLEWKSVPYLDQGLIYAAARDITRRKEADVTLRHLHEELEARVSERTAELAAANDLLQIENVQHELTMGTLRELADAYRHAKEEADNANRAKSEFLSRMSHELRTPLNAVLGFGQILAAEDLPESARESVDYILAGGEHLLELVNEVLDIAGVESGRMDLNLEPTFVAEVVGEVCALVRPLASRRRITIIESTDALDGQLVLADRQRFKQVLINLLSNAIKYNQEGGRVEISSYRQEVGWTDIAVADTGPGIAPEDMAKLFTPFERLKAANTTVEGTGLGLVLSRRLVEAMGGSLNVQSEVGQGTTFTVELPTAAVIFASAEATLNPLPPNAESLSTSQWKVLCIEDNPSNMKLMEAIFDRRPNIHMLRATQGPMGLDMARHYQPDLILLDFDLPGMKAPEIMARLHQMAQTREIPIVIVSADATQGQIDRMIQAGARDYITKPLNIAHFLRTVERYLKSKSSDSGIAI